MPVSFSREAVIHLSEVADAAEWFSHLKLEDAFTGYRLPRFMADSEHEGDGTLKGAFWSWEGVLSSCSAVHR